MLEQIIIIALIVLAVYTTMREGMIFERLGVYLENNIRSEFLKKPIFACPICMTFWHGLLWYSILWGLNWWALPVVISAMGLQVIIANFVDL